jgi:hypothetical protein
MKPAFPCMQENSKLCIKAKRELTCSVHASRLSLGLIRFSSCSENRSTIEAAVLLGEYENEDPHRSMRRRHSHHHHRHHCRQRDVIETSGAAILITIIIAANVTSLMQASPPSSSPSLPPT